MNTIDQPTAHRQRHNHLVFWAILTLLGSLVLLHLWLYAVTEHAARSGALWRGQVPGMLDVGLDVNPPTSTRPGAVELWIYPHDADDYTPILRLYGAPPHEAAPQPATPTAPPHVPKAPTVRVRFSTNNDLTR